MSADENRKAVICVKIIGYIKSTYPEIRCVIDKGGDGCRYIKIGQVNDFLIRCRRALPKIVGRVFHRPEKTNWNHRAIFKPFGKQSVDLIHTFNAVCDTDTPWVSTFETIIPRTNITCSPNVHGGKPQEMDKITKRGFELLGQDSCRAVIALSEANKKIQLMEMERLNVPNREQIARKIRVCHPPQPVLISEEACNHKFDNVNKGLEFIFVGRPFFRKGGAQVVDALTELRKQYPDIHLTVVSGLRYGDDVSRSTAEDKEKYKKLMEESSWITHYEALPNSDVIDLCRKAHVGLLPTFADTYGYSVLEMQACGCPVITTDVRALPEINREECGYLIHVPKHLSTEAKYARQEDLEILKETVYQGLYSQIKDILENRGALKEKSAQCIRRIAEEHSPEKYARFLSGVYGISDSEDEGVCIQADGLT